MNTHPDYALLSIIRDMVYDIANSYQIEDFLYKSIDKSQREMCAWFDAKNFDDIDGKIKSILGFKIEHEIRKEFCFHSGVRDLNIVDKLTVINRDRLVEAAIKVDCPHPFDVDVKNSLTNSHLIPPESYRENGVLLLTAYTRHAANASMGLAIAKPEYLREKSNRDEKKNFTGAGKKNFLWIAGPMSRR